MGTRLHSRAWSKGGFALLVSATVALGQGTFQNLNFESAQIPSGTPPLSLFDFGTALPGWSGSYSNAAGISPAPFVGYDSVSLGGAFVSIIDTLNVGSQPLQGNYSAYLFGGRDPYGNGTTSTISQTGLVPYGAVSIFMNVSALNGFTVSMGGQTINMVVEGGGPSYMVYRGDISAFAGQTAQLSITAPEPPYPSITPTRVLIDDIRFGTIPEPSVFAVSCLGALLLCWWALRLRGCQPD